MLRRHCDDVGRDHDTIRTTILHVGAARTDVDAFIDAMADYAALGIDDAIVMPAGDQPDVWIEEWPLPVIPLMTKMLTGRSPHGANSVAPPGPDLRHGLIRLDA